MLNLQNLINDAVVRGFDTAFANAIPCDGTITAEILAIPEIKAMVALFPQATAPVKEAKVKAKGSESDLWEDRITYLLQNGELTVGQILTKVPFSHNKVRRLLNGLVLSGKVKVSQSYSGGRGRPSFVYRMA